MQAQRQRLCAPPGKRAQRMPRSERFARFVATCYAKRASKRKIVRRRRQLCEHLCPWRLADSQTSTEWFSTHSQMPAWPSRRTLSASKILQASRRSQLYLRLFRGRRQQERTTPAEKSAIEFFVRESGGHIVTACMGLEECCAVCLPRFLAVRPGARDAGVGGRHPQTRDAKRSLAMLPRPMPTRTGRVESSV